MVMSTRLDTCMEALRSLARSSELEANRLPTAELRIRDFLTSVGTNRAAAVQLAAEVQHSRAAVVEHSRGRPAPAAPYCRPRGPNHRRPAGMPSSSQVRKPAGRTLGIPHSLMAERQ